MRLGDVAVVPFGIWDTAVCSVAQCNMVISSHSAVSHELSIANRLLLVLLWTPDLTACLIDLPGPDPITAAMLYTSWAPAAHRGS